MRGTTLSFALAVLASACAAETLDGPAVCDEAAAVFAECGTALDESPFGTCQEAQRLDAMDVLTAYDGGGCEALADRKADGFTCTAIPFVCVVHTVAELVPFTTDGCSMFPDGSPEMPLLWQHCCIEHDYLYYTGGTRDERAAADEALYDCVSAASGSDTLGNAMWSGVRVGGTPSMPTSWRWGYGWAYDPFDGYRDLSAEERAAAAAAVEAYRMNPTPVPGFEERAPGLEREVLWVPGLMQAREDVNVQIQTI